MEKSAATRADRHVLVVSPCEGRRSDWSSVVADDRTVVETCPGPDVDCWLTRGHASCPLVAWADLALYDIDGITPSFLATLLQAHGGAAVVLARDRLVRGQHRPSAVMRRERRPAQ